MNVLIAINSNISYTSGGLERTTLNLFEYLNKHDGINAFGLFNDCSKDIPFQNKIIKGVIQEPNYLNKIIKEYNIDILLFPAGPWYTLIGSKAVKGTKCKIITAYHAKYDSKDYIFRKQLISKLRYGKSFKVKIKSLIQLLLFPVYYQKNYNFWQKVIKKGYAKTDAFVLLSERYILPFVEYFSLEDNNKFYGIGNALSFEEYIGENEFVNKENKILIVGRLSEASKRISVSIKAWSKLKDIYPDWELVIVGDGRDKKYYQNLKKRYNIENLTFEGRQNPIQYYKESKMFLMTSAVEGWGMTITEAMQFGCVPICIDSFEALHDIVQNNENGLIIKNDENIVENLKTKIELLINNTNLNERLARNAIESSKQFTMENIGKKWTQLFEELLK